MGSASFPKARYLAIFTYRYKDGLLDVAHEITHLAEAQQLLDNGPDPRSLEKLTVTLLSENKITIRG